MMHPYLLASLLIGGVAVVAVAILVFQDMQEEEPFHAYTEEKQTRENSSRHGQGQQDDYELPPMKSEEQFLLNLDEEEGLRRRKRNPKSTTSQQSSPLVQNENEQELLDKLSYLNAIEQEIERKKKALAEEERIIGEKEHELEMRKKHLQSVSSCSSSNSGLSQNIPSSSCNVQVVQNTSTNDATRNSISIEEKLSGSVGEQEYAKNLSGSPRVVNLSSESDNHVVDDIMAHNILSQNLTHISYQQQQQQQQRKQDPCDTLPSVDADSSAEEFLQNPPVIGRQTLNPHNARGYQATGSAASETSWSDIGSVITDQHDAMSSGTDIDLDDMDVIEH